MWYKLRTTRFLLTKNWCTNDTSVYKRTKCSEHLSTHRPPGIVLSTNYGLTEAWLEIDTERGIFQKCFPFMKGFSPLSYLEFFFSWNPEKDNHNTREYSNIIAYKSKAKPEVKNAENWQKEVERLILLKMTNDCEM